jgi:sugar lactone lactonase YvrE
MVWTQDGHFLISDSNTGEFYRYDYLADAGRIVNRAVFSKGLAQGVPDGSALDIEGGVWNARFGGSCIVRFSPTGSVDRVLELPAINPTSCTFGGPDCNVLLVTTASFGVTAAQRESLPGQGSVFAIEVGIKGVADNLFAG